MLIVSWAFLSSFSPAGLYREDPRMLEKAGHNKHDRIVTASTAGVLSASSCGTFLLPQGVTGSAFHHASLADGPGCSVGV